MRASPSFRLTYSLSLSSLSGALLLMLAATTLSARAQAQTLCYTSIPIPPELAENDSVYGQLCGLLPGSGGSPLPCPAPNPPALEPGSTRAQGLILTAQVPYSVSSAVAVWWEAYVVDPDTGARLKLWTHRSVQGIPPGGKAPGEVVRFGAPGLVENATHYFRVAFENSNGHKTCLSPWSAAIPTTDFRGLGPLPPADMSPKVEDEFHRPATDPAHGTTAGDGLGPEAVWWSSDATNPPHEAHIWDDEEHASVTPSSSIVYERVMESDAATYAQAKVRVNLADSSAESKYNFQVQARIGEMDPNTGSAPSYAVKLIYGPRGCDRPTLLLFRLPDEYEDAKCMDSDGDGTIEPLPPGVFCENAPPLETPDPANPDVSLPVWLRIEVRNKTNVPDGTQYPVIRGQAYWENGQGGWTTCTPTTVERPDSDDPAHMADVRGNWGASFHEKYYLIDVFEAGDGKPGGPGP